MATQNEVRVWMKTNVEAFVDRCDEVSATYLAEAAALEFDLYVRDPGWTIPEWVFEASADVAERYANRSAREKVEGLR